MQSQTEIPFFLAVLYTKAPWTYSYFTDSSINAMLCIYKIEKHLFEMYVLLVW